MIKQIFTSTEKCPAIAYTKSGKGPALILIHGFPEDGGLWRLVKDTFSKHFTLLIPDMPGTGKSTFVGEDISIEELAEAVFAVVQDAVPAAERVVVCGHSMGGYIALAFAELYSERLAGFGLLHSTTKNDNEEKVLKRQKSIQLIRKGGKEPFINGMIPNLFSPQTKQEQPQLLEEQSNRGQALKDNTLIAFYQAMINRPDRTFIFEGLNVPVLLLMGLYDEVIPNEDGMSLAKFSDVTFVSIMDRSGHMSMLEQPEDFAEALYHFADYCHSCNTP